MRTYTHESKELNALIGKRVIVKFFDDDVIEGKLLRSGFKDKYELQHSKGSLLFRKTHVKKIEYKGV